MIISIHNTHYCVYKIIIYMWCKLYCENRIGRAVNVYIYISLGKHANIPLGWYRVIIMTDYVYKLHRYVCGVLIFWWLILISTVYRECYVLYICDACMRYMYTYVIHVKCTKITFAITFCTVTICITITMYMCCIIISQLTV